MILQTFPQTICPQMKRLRISVVPKDSAFFWVVLMAASASLLLAGCKKDVAQEAAESDANGYLCLRCGAKLYTDRSVFLTAICPKCQQDGLVEVVAYDCAKDHHSTLRGRTDDRRGALVCEQCQGPVNGMRLPREKDLKAWGATKVKS
jgi:hypothetical protein